MTEKTARDWMTIKDEETGLKIDFPHKPLEMTFDIPFQNTPSLGKIRFYSIPLTEGTLILSIFNSSTINPHTLDKREFHQFLETILVPHLFFDPSIFRNKQVFSYKIQEDNGEKSAVFQISYFDEEIKKKLEGIAKVKKHILYTFFYLAPEGSFDKEILHRFLKSVHI